MTRNKMPLKNGLSPEGELDFKDGSNTTHCAQGPSAKALKLLRSDTDLLFKKRVYRTNQLFWVNFHRGYTDGIPVKLGRKL